jgi:predicted nucleic acid-binding protein
VLIVDAGPLYAAAATQDNDHGRCAALLSEAPGPLLVPELVVTEVSYLLSDRIGPHAELVFARAIAAGELLVEPVLDSEWKRIAELMDQYLDLPLGITDASLVVLAERHSAAEIATLDHRHLGVVRPRHLPSFTLLPSS